MKSLRLCDGWRVIVTGMIALPATLLSQTSDGPAWWRTRGVVDTAVVFTNDFAAANGGQLKWLTAKACEELDAHLPGGAGDSIRPLVAHFTCTNSFACVNAGQIKSVHVLFLQRFDEEGFPVEPSWSAGTDDDADDALVNIGQLKNAFAWDLTRDDTGDGLPDWWQTLHFGSGPSSAPDDADGDGLANGVEYGRGTDPLGSDTDGDGVPDLLDPNPRDGADADHDGIPDDWERYWFDSLAGDGSGDDDGDQASDGAEYADATDPTIGTQWDQSEIILLEIYWPVRR